MTGLVDTVLKRVGVANPSVGPAPSSAVMNTYGRFPLTLVRGKGCWVWDDRGQRYLDAVAGIATDTLGHSDRVMRRQLQRQLRRLQHVSNLYRIPEQEELAQWLVDHSCADSVFFCNSGAEANEAAIKLARKHGHRQRGIDRPVILTAAASFHGRTLAAVTATGQPKYHQGFEPVVEGFDYFQFNDITSFETTLERHEAQGPKVAAVLIEPLQGEGGVNPGDRAFFQAVRRRCSERNILLILDEVQVGMGRSGRLWGYEQLGIAPDAFTLAKASAVDTPLGPCWCRRAPTCSSPATMPAPSGAIPSPAGRASRWPRKLNAAVCCNMWRNAASSCERGSNNWSSATPRCWRAHAAGACCRVLFCRRAAAAPQHNWPQQPSTNACCWWPPAPACCAWFPLW